MVRAPCCDKMGLNKGPWMHEEDQCLISYIQQNGHPNWRALPKLSGLLRCGKSRWSVMAAKLPGRTDNEIKNVWHTHIKKKLKTYQSTRDTEKHKNKISEPQSGRSDSFTRKEIDSLGYGSIPRQSSSSELSSLNASPDIVKQELLISSQVSLQSSSSELSSATTNPELISSKVTLSEIRESFWPADITYQDTEVCFDIDQGLKYIKGDDSMDFWYNLFMTAEELQEF